MTMPSQEAQRSRETAMQAERHWHITRLQALVDRWRQTARRQDVPEFALIYGWCADDLDRLIAERTK